MVVLSKLRSRVSRYRKMSLASSSSSDFWRSNRLSRLVHPLKLGDAGMWLNNNGGRGSSSSGGFGSGRVNGGDRRLSFGSVDFHRVRNLSFWRHRSSGRGLCSGRRCRSKSLARGRGNGGGWCGYRCRSGHGSRTKRVSGRRQIWMSNCGREHDGTGCTAVRSGNP